jgi:hypothetical protein
MVKKTALLHNFSFQNFDSGLEAALLFFFVKITLYGIVYFIGFRPFLKVSEIIPLNTVFFDLSADSWVGGF